MEDYKKKYEKALAVAKTYHDANNGNPYNCNGLALTEAIFPELNKMNNQLLLADLCARLLYGVYVKELREQLDSSPVLYTWDYHPCIDNCKPYLRPMSSMTDEEKVEYGKVLETMRWTDELDFYNKYHFDYRGLIEKGLAIAAPDGMYN